METNSHILWTSVRIISFLGHWFSQITLVIIDQKVTGFNLFFLSSSLDFILETDQSVFVLTDHLFKSCVTDVVTSFITLLSIHDRYSNGCSIYVSRSCLSGEFSKEILLFWAGMENDFIVGRLFSGEFLLKDSFLV